MMKRQLRLWATVLLLATVLTSCGQKTDTSNASRWQTAMSDAVFAEDEEVRPLVTLTAEDSRVIWDDAGERVLLLTWHDYPSACEPGTAIGEYGDIWATSLGEMKSWFKENGEEITDRELRFAQLLGVHEDEGYTRFTAFWVSPRDVVRPAFVTDVTKQMVNDYGLVTGEWKEWFDSNILFSYFESDYPWTRLGYTYDWGGTQEYGLTEFLVRDPSRTEIAFTLTTDEFAEYLKTTEGDQNVDPRTDGSRH